MSATKQVLVGGFILTTFSIMASFFAYLTKLVLVRNLSVEEYGLFFSVLTFVLFLQVFISLGLPTGLSRTIAKYRINNSIGRIKSIIVGSFIIQMSMALFLMLILFLLNEYLSTYYFKNEYAKWLLIILSLYFPLNVIRTQFSSIFNGFSKNFYLGQISFIYNLSLFLSILVGFYFFSGIYVPTFSYLFAFFILFLFLFFPLFKTFNVFKNNIKNFKSANKELLNFSFPLLFTVMGTVFISYFDTIMLTYFTDLTQVGVYNIILPTAFLLVIIGSSLGLALLPIITKLFEEGEKKIISSAFSQIYLNVSFLIIPTIITLGILSEDIIRIFFGEEYLIGLVVFNILVFGSFFIIFLTIQNQALLGVGKSSSVMWVYLFGAFLNIILNLLLIPFFLIIGAGIATIISYFFMFIFSFYLLNKEFKLNFPILKVLFMFIFSLVIIIFIEIFWIFNYNIYIMTLLGLIFGWGFYLILVILFKVIDLFAFFNLLGIDFKNLLKKYIPKK